jgi:hypothetical protein
VFADSVWTPVAGYLVDLPERYSQGEAYNRYVSARERTVDYLLTLVPNANSVLTDSQRRRLPFQISNYLDRRVLRFLRSRADVARRIGTPSGECIRNSSGAASIDNVARGLSGEAVERAARTARRRYACPRAGSAPT